MHTTSALDSQWPALVSALSGTLDLDLTARQSGALRRRRAVADGATLLRLALAYGPGGLSLRSAAAWAGLQGVASLSDVALMKRLRGAADWLGLVAGALLRGAQATTTPLAGRPLRIVDGSAIAQPGSAGTDWRLHATYDPKAARFVHLELTDAHGAEGFARAPLQAGDVVLGDRFYARPRGLQDVLSARADFIVRVGWSSLRLVTAAGTPLDWEPIYASLAPGEIAEREVWVEHAGKGGKRRGQPLFRARLIVVRKDEAANARAEKAVRRSHNRRRNQRVLQPLTIAAAGFLMVLTSLPAETAPAADVLAAYRLRWQIELAFKRLKSGLGIHRLPAKGEQLARSWLLAHLIVALLIDEAVQDVLDSPPCAPARHPAAALALAAARRAPQRHPRRRAAYYRTQRYTPATRHHAPTHLRPAQETNVTGNTGPHP